MGVIGHFSILLLVISYAETKSLTGGSYGCTEMDHASCDEVCKTDGMWYGYCSAWNGVDFQCRCFSYAAPLDSFICKNYKNYCNSICMIKNKQNGYCYPAQDLRDPRGVPKCKCFKELPQEFML